VGDIWPYGPPRYTTYAAVLQIAINARFTNAQAQIWGGIAGAEASYDLSVINDTPSTGDYSVGTFQINYYGNLYAGRASAYGTPAQLIAGGLTAQFAAALGVYRSQGFNAWSTYRSGAWQKYASGVVTSVTTSPGNTTAALPGHDISPPTEDYSGTIRSAAAALTQNGNQWKNAYAALTAIKDTNPRG
jgi:hypothetical protein